MLNKHTQNENTHETYKGNITITRINNEHNNVNTNNPTPNNQLNLTERKTYNRHNHKPQQRIHK